MFFKAARMAGWLPDPKEKKFPKTSHVGFGLVLGADGKRFRTRSTEVVRLGDLLDEAKSRSKSELLQRLTENGKIVDWTDEELEQTSKAVGYGAVKYADLKNNRLTNYTFSFDQMLSDKGKYRCLSSVCSCSYLLHYSKIQHGCRRAKSEWEHFSCPSR
uniref:Arginyl-tRNA synthetase catalytic core domain-containing protein n=1 Tax=Aegilops tauschii subsp. strangulata TaxID=200361 RepID=A0A452Y3D5_AEGTS